MFEEHGQYFDEHDEEDQELLWERVKEIAQDNDNNGLFADEIFEEEI